MELPSSHNEWERDLEAGPRSRLRAGRQADADRPCAFGIVDEHRPPRRDRPFDPARLATRAECLSDAGRGVWTCATDLQPVDAAFS